MWNLALVPISADRALASEAVVGSWMRSDHARSSRESWSTEVRRWDEASDTDHFPPPPRVRDPAVSPGPPSYPPVSNGSSARGPLTAIKLVLCQSRDCWD